MPCRMIFATKRASCSRPMPILNGAPSHFHRESGQAVCHILQANLFRTDAHKGVENEQCTSVCTSLTPSAGALSGDLGEVIQLWRMRKRAAKRRSTRRAWPFDCTRLNWREVVHRIPLDGNLSPPWQRHKRFFTQFEVERERESLRGLIACSRLGIAVLHVASDTLLEEGFYPAGWAGTSSELMRGSSPISIDIWVCCTIPRNDLLVVHPEPAGHWTLCLGGRGMRISIGSEG